MFHEAYARHNNWHVLTLRLSTLHLELIVLQNDEELREKYISVKYVDFFKCCKNQNIVIHKLSVEDTFSFRSTYHLWIDFFFNEAKKSELRAW
jgi:hypothetical protein